MQGPRLSSHSNGSIPSNFTLVINNSSTTNDKDNSIEPHATPSVASSLNQLDSKNEKRWNDQGGEDPIKNGSRMTKFRRLLVRQSAFLGPGIIASVAYGES